MKCTFISALVSLAIAGCSLPAFAELDAIELLNDSTGGDCTTVGHWNASTLTCTLTENLNSKKVVFEDSDITLDCDGFSMTGDQNPPDHQAPDVAISLGSGPPTGVTVMNCHIMNFCQAIYFNNSEHNRILRNTIENVNSSGGCESGDGDQVHIDDDHDVIMGNVFINNVGGDGLGLNFDDRDGTGTQVVNNKFFNQDNSNVIRVDCDNGATGDGTLIKQNLIQDEGRSNDGIQVTDPECANITVVSNRIHRVGGRSGDCIEIEGSNHTVAYNLCQSTADEAFEIETDDSLFEGNTLVKSNLSELEIDQCSARDSEFNATIEFECGSGNEFINNTIVGDYCGSGILFEDRSCSYGIGEKNDNIIEGNRIYGNLFHGIFIRDPDSTGNVIRDNKIYQNGLSGIRNDGVNTVIEDNMIRSNGEWGVEENGTGTTISGNKGNGGALGKCTGAGC
jgi:parallel beta-helix repeat protein